MQTRHFRKTCIGLIAGISVAVLGGCYPYYYGHDYGHGSSHYNHGFKGKKHYYGGGHHYPGARYDRRIRKRYRYYRYY